MLSYCSHAKNILRIYEAETKKHYCYKAFMF